MSIDRRIHRNPSAEIDSMFIDRWSPRAFKPLPLGQDQINSLFEAARWAPSCFNDQPWLFVYASEEKDRERFLTALAEGNQVWAKNASLIIFLLFRKNFSHNDQENRHAPFDAGAAWMSLALQARKLGLYAHAMAGFSRQKAYELIQAPESQYDIIAAIAVGCRTQPEILPDTIAAKEIPSDRKKIEEVMREGKY